MSGSAGRNARAPQEWFAERWTVNVMAEGLGLDDPTNPGRAPGGGSRAKPRAGSISCAPALILAATAASFGKASRQKAVNVWKRSSIPLTSWGLPLGGGRWMSNALPL